MSNRVKKVGQAVKKRTQEQVMQCMEEVFELPLSQELKLRRTYRRYMKKARREQKRLIKMKEQQDKAIRKAERKRARERRY